MNCIFKEQKYEKRLYYRLSARSMNESDTL